MTAYEMGISDWSSDVFSSDLDAGVGAYGSYSIDDLTLTARLGQESADGVGGFVADLGLKWASQIMDGLTLTVGSEVSWADQDYMNKIGRASCRERVCQYV